MIPIRGLRAPVAPVSARRPFSTQKRAGSPWNRERDDQLQRLWEAGKSGEQIARALGEGFTKNSVIGRVHRLQLERRPNPVERWHG